MSLQFLTQKTETVNITGPVPLNESYDRTSFDCGVEVLNDYLKKYAHQNTKNNSCRTYVALKDNKKIIGYFSIAFGSVEHAIAPPKITHGLGRYPVPVLVLARLAVDKSYQNIGLGRSLLKHALLKAINAAEIGGLRAVIVHAKGDRAKSFYEKYGFSPAPSDPFHLFILIKNIHESLK